MSDYELWKEKGRFPSDKAVKDLLSHQNDAYNEIKTVIPEFFEQYDELLKKQINIYINRGLIPFIFLTIFQISQTKRSEQIFFFLF